MIYEVDGMYFTKQEGAAWYARVLAIHLGVEPEITEIDDDACLPPDEDYRLLPIIAGYEDGQLVSLAVAQPADFEEGVWGDHIEIDFASGEASGFTGEVHLFAYSLEDAIALVDPLIAADIEGRFGAPEEAVVDEF